MFLAKQNLPFRGPRDQMLEERKGNFLQMIELLLREHLIKLEQSTQSQSGTVAVFRTGVRGARILPRETRGPQNLFDVHGSAKLTANLRDWVGGGALKTILRL
ncbi:hypothetical protein AVEN_35749-1 [Araneus ventricosus]|uniref:Uncharacterized protein n=1 Tax=Araneus ventricosus TaxID=182803 RepID=A0A4Y2FJG5_ARAVE|nr:hypothetical protein AVEN_35749-1 [Araneus ventricosus]